MPTNHDYWNENIHTVYTDVVEIFEADEDQNPIDPENGIIRLNNSGNTLTMYTETYDPENPFGVRSYMPAAFTFDEPDRNSINDETGSFSIAGVTSNYIEMLNNADSEHKIVVRLGLVDYKKAVDSATAEEPDDSHWIYKLLSYEASDVSINSATATVQINFRSGAMQLQYYISKLRYGNTEFPCLFG